MSEITVNMFSGSPLNRLSWLRPSHSFLNAIVVSPSTRWLLFKSGQPLVLQVEKESKPSIALLSTKDIRPFLGQEPFFGQGQQEGELASPESKSPHGESSIDGARHRGSPVVFLGLHEPAAVESALPLSDFHDPHAAIANLQGTAFFAMDLADFDDSEVDGIIKTSEPLGSAKEASLTWREPRSMISTLDAFMATIFAEARSMVDWNLRNKFCPGCGSPAYSMWGGWKISCTSLLPWVSSSDRKPCLTAKGLHNFTHPRTDPVVIMIAIDQTGDRILLGRNRKFPGKFYSALAGFIEPGESFEDAVAREMWEEAGVNVWNVTYHSTQPWPYPASLMVGFYAQADASQPIRVDLDNELQDARWYTREEILAVLNHPSGTYLSSRDHRQLAMQQEGKNNLQRSEPSQGAGVLAHSDPNIQSKSEHSSEGALKPQGMDDPLFRVPPPTAIAGVLIRDWANEKIGFSKNKLQKGNL